MNGFRSLALAVLFVVFFAATPASAYTVETQVTPGCHERITADALRRVRDSLANAKPVGFTRSDDDALAQDLPFKVPDDLYDLGGVSLLVGVRDNDLKGVPATSLDELVELTSENGGQREHCLRSNEDTEPNGSKTAVDSCRAYILDQLTAALDGLDAQGSPDPNVRDSIEVDLAVRGQIHVDLQRFYLRIGMAMHAIEDSYAHTWRNVDDPKKIDVVLNWIAYSENRIDEGTTGPAHESEMDRCDDPDALRFARRGLATEAAAEALMTALDPSLNRAQKIQGFQNVLDTYVSYDAAAACNVGNGWCNAPERQYANGCGCALAGAPPTNGKMALVSIGVLCILFAARRSRALVAAALVVFVALLFAPSSARAADEADAGAPPAGTPGGEAKPDSPPPSPLQPPPQVSSGSGPLEALRGNSASGQKGVEDRAGAKFVSVGFGASYDRPALVARVGGRYALSRMWMLGLDAEWNPYLAVGESNFRKGAIDVYASLIARFQLAYEPINLRSSVSLGGSILLTDLVGAPSGSFGPYFGLSLLGLEVKLGKGFYLTVDPTTLAIPVPHITGIPFVYYQYRFMLGIEFGG